MVRFFHLCICFHTSSLCIFLFPFFLCLPVTAVGRSERIFETLIDYFLFIIYKSTATTDIKMYRSTKLEKKFFIRSKIRFSFHWLGLEEIDNFAQILVKTFVLKQFINDLIHQTSLKLFFPNRNLSNSWLLSHPLGWVACEVILAVVSFLRGRGFSSRHRSKAIRKPSF